MSNLTVGLAILGGVVLAGVVAHGAWTTRRNAPKVLRTEHARLEDEGDTRREPTLEAMADAAALLPGAGVGHSLEAGRTWPPTERRLGLDALIDVIAPILLDHVVSGEAAHAHLPTTRRAGSKPFSIEGLNDRSQVWETPVARQLYKQFQAGVQLANRAGPLNDIEFSEFMQKASAFADSIEGRIQFPDMREAVARARELDTFAASHDAQLSVSLRARNAAWSAGFVQLHAARQGFVAGAAPGRMVLPSATPGLPPLLVLNFDSRAALSDDPTQSAMRSVTLGLDVPTVGRAEQPFVRMRDAAIALAAAMEASITDERGVVLMLDALDAIGADLEVLYDALQGRDLSAGSPQARRLFS